MPTSATISQSGRHFEPLVKPIQPPPKQLTRCGCPEFINRNWKRKRQLCAGDLRIAELHFHRPRHGDRLRLFSVLKIRDHFRTARLLSSIGRAPSVPDVQRPDKILQPVVQRPDKTLQLGGEEILQVKVLGKENLEIRQPKKIVY